MMAVAIREELNYLFSDSLSDADLLRAVEFIESTQTFMDRAPPTGTTTNVVHNTSRSESSGNAGGVETAAQLHFGRILLSVHLLFVKQLPCRYRLIAGP